MAWALLEEIRIRRLFDTRVGPDREQSARQSPRVSLTAEVTLRRAGQINYAVRLYDLSPHGCKVEFVQRPSLNESVWVKIDGLEALAASVCWVRPPEAGLEFHKPIHPAVYRMLVDRLENRQKGV